MHRVTVKKQYRHFKKRRGTVQKNKNGAAGSLLSRSTVQRDLRMPTNKAVACLVTVITDETP